MKRRTVLTAALGTVLESEAMAVRRTSSAALPHEASATALSQALGEGRSTAEALVAASLARIEAVDRRGPRLNSVIELNPEATSIARALDAERRAGRLRGPLHGLPVLLKDNISTGDRMRTSGGSLALAEVRAVRDAHLVQRLRAAGAVILGRPTSASGPTSAPPAARAAGAAAAI